MSEEFQLKHYQNNPRQITERKFEHLKRTMARFGDLGGIVHNLETGELIGGNQRSEAGAFMSKIPVITEEFDPPLEDGTVKVGYFVHNGSRFNYRAVRWDRQTSDEANLIANAAGGSWDWEALASFGEETLRAAGFDEELYKSMRLDVTNMKEFLTVPKPPRDEQPEVDQAEELLKKWKVKPGDMFSVGDHRVMCGSCVDDQAVDMLLEERAVELCVTSAPYPGAEMWKKEEASLIKLVNDCIQSLANVIMPSGFLVWNTSDIARGNEGFVPNVARDTMTAINAGFRLRGEVIWHKSISYMPPIPFTRRPVIPNNTHEQLLVFCHGDWKPREKKGTLTTEQMQWMLETVWSIGTESAKKVGHIAPFPLELAYRCIALFSLEQEAVYEPFLGSGTTMVAAEHLKRRCFGMELEPKYVALTLERMQATFEGITIKKL